MSGIGTGMWVGAGIVLAAFLYFGYAIAGFYITDDDTNVDADSLWQEYPVSVGLAYLAMVSMKLLWKVFKAVFRVFHYVAAPLGWLVLGVRWCVLKLKGGK